MTWERTAGASAAVAPERVWDVLLDGRRWSLWIPGVEWMTVENALQPGGLLTMKPKGLRQTAFRIEAVRLQRLLALAVRFGPVATLRLRWELAPVPGGTQIVHTVGIAGPFAGLLLRRAAERIAHDAPASLERLAARAVSLAAETA
jgi:uncharacterized protein YndB with AHSA1/START domain